MLLGRRVGSREGVCCVPTVCGAGQEDEEEEELLQHPGVNLSKDKPEPQIRPGAEGPEFGAVGKLG